jgi:hypothetical protein
MPRPKRTIEYHINKIINEELMKFNIIEAINSLISTKYEKILDSKSKNTNYIADTYRFMSNNNNSYDVEFYEINIIFKYIKLLDGSFLPDLYNEVATKGIILAFSPTEIDKTKIPDDIIGTMDDPSIKKTNRFEQYEVLGKVAYLIQEYMNNNPQYDVYVIGKNTHKNNLTIYQYIFKNIFANNFYEFESVDNFYYIMK